MNRHLLISVFCQIAVGGLFLNLAPVTSNIVREFGVSYADVGLLTTSFIVGQALISMPAGYLSDRFGVKRIYLTANLCVVFVVLLLALSTSMVQITILRFFLGVVMGTQFIVGSSYLAYWSPPERTTLYQGLYGSGFNIGITLSFLLAGPQVELLGWRGVFLVPGALTALAALVLGFCVIEPRDKPVGPSVTLGRLLELPVLKLTLLGVCMSTAWATFVVVGAWLTEYLMVERQGIFWLSAVLAGINMAGSGIGRAMGGVAARPGNEGRALVWFYGAVLLAAAGLLVPAPLPVTLLLAFLVVTLSSMGFAPTIRLAVQDSRPGLQGTAVGYVLALGMILGSPQPSIFGWLVGVSGSFIVGFLLILASPLAGILAIIGFRWKKAGNCGVSVK